LVRGEDDEDNFSTAVRTVTRKKKDQDEESRRKIAKRDATPPLPVTRLIELQILAVNGLSISTSNVCNSYYDTRYGF